MRIGQKAEEAQLADATTSNVVRAYAFEPRFRQGMVNMAVGSERNPDVDIRQEDHRN